MDYNMSKTLTVYLAANLKDFNSGLNEAEAKSQSFSGKLSGMLGPALIAAGAAAAAFAVRLGVEGVQAALEDEKALTALNTTLGNLGFGAQASEVDDFIQQLSRSTGVADDELRPAFDRLIRSTGDLGEAQSALRLAMDVSVGTTRSLDSVAQALGRAYDGNTAGLSRLGAGISKATLATGDMQAITKELAGTFQGQAQAAAETYQGRLNRISVAADEAKEAIGYALLDALDRVSNAFGGTDGAISSIDSFGEGMSELITSIGYLTEDIALLVNQLRGGTQATDDMAQANVDLVDQMLALVPIAGAWLTAIKNGYDGQREAATAANKATQQVADSYGDAYRALGQYQRGTFGASKATEEMTADTDNLSRALAQLEGRARTAAAAWASAYGPVLTALLDVGAVDEFWKRVTKLDLGAAPKGTADVVDNLNNVGGAASQAAETLTKAQQKMVDAAQKGLTQLVSDLDLAVADLESKHKDVEAWANKMQTTLFSAFDLKAAYKSSINKEGELDGIEWIKGLTAQINKLDWFGNVLTELQRRGVDPNLIEYLRSAGVDAGGAMGQAMIDHGLVPEMNGLFVTAQTAAANMAASMVPSFLTEAENMAIGTVQQLENQVNASKTKLIDIGKAIGKPVGAGFAKEILDSVADALEKAEKARSAAQARRQAEQASQAVTAITDQQIGQSLQRIINNSNARAGYASNAFGIVLG